MPGSRLLPAAVICSHAKPGLGVAFVSVTGELDVATAPLLERKLREVTAKARLVVLDLRELSFIDTAGIRVVAAANAPGIRGRGRLVVLRAPPTVDHVLALSGAADELEIHDLDPDEPPVQVLLQLAAREPAVA